jgi:threonine aldolase
MTVHAALVSGPAQTSGMEFSIPDFRSDNVSGVCSEIFAALAAENCGTAPAYGEDSTSKHLDAIFSDLFECEVAVFPTITGTAANALALASIAPPYTAVLCHREAHIAADEAGAVEFYGDLRLVSLPSGGGKLTPVFIREALAGRRSSGALRFAAISIAQPTEDGSVYTTDEIAALSEVARLKGLAFHMDGARFANAVASLGCRPAQVTCDAGVNVLSFGATKNGALAAEAVVFFDRNMALDFTYRRKRGGHTLSKMRFLSTQLAAYVTQGVWLRNAANANAQAAALARGLARVPGVELICKVESNLIFARVPEQVIAGFAAGDVHLYRWGPPGSNIVRLVTSFDTNQAQVAAFIGMAQQFAHRNGNSA